MDSATSRYNGVCCDDGFIPVILEEEIYSLNDVGIVRSHTDRAVMG